jgi:DNA-directed RNA polymerase subunit M/transcription elongation factor TFIIS
MIIRDITTEVRIVARCMECNDILTSRRDEQNDTKFVIFLAPCPKCGEKKFVEGKEYAFNLVQLFAKNEDRKRKKHGKGNEETKEAKDLSIVSFVATEAEIERIAGLETKVEWLKKCIATLTE